MIYDRIQPGGRSAAPGSLRLVQDFVNTNDLEDGFDRLGTPDSLRSWLLREGLISGETPVDDGDVGRVQRIREAIRSLAMANNGRKPDPDAVRVFDEMPSASTGRLRFDRAGSAFLEPLTGGVEGALFAILASVYRAMTDGTWSRMKACRRDVCRWLFFDQSRNRSSTWCAMAVCGNRVKTAAFYRRRKRAASAPPPIVTAWTV